MKRVRGLPSLILFFLVVLNSYSICIGADAVIHSNKASTPVENVLTIERGPCISWLLIKMPKPRRQHKMTPPRAQERDQSIRWITTFRGIAT